MISGIIVVISIDSIHSFKNVGLSYKIYFVSGSLMSKFDGIVKASSPAWRNLITSPPNTHEIFLRRLNPVPNGETDQWVTWKDALTIALSSSFVACY